MTSPALLLLLALAGSARVPQVAPQASQEVLADSLTLLVDSARGELARGRFWRASLLLRGLQDGAPGLLPSWGLPLLARAEVGWGNWEGVVELLEEPLGAETATDPVLWFSLARGLEGLGRWEGAAEAYGRALEGSGPSAGEGEDTGSRGDGEAAGWDRLEAEVRRARSWGRAGKWEQAVVGVEAVAEEDSASGAWLALELARAAAEEGRRGELHGLLERIPEEVVLELGWELEARAALAAGDSSGAEAAYWSTISRLPSGADRALAWQRVGELRLARDDTVGARGAFHRVLQLPASLATAVGAADGLMALGFDSLGAALGAARSLARSGRHRDALRVYGVHQDLLAGTSPSPGVLLERARAHLAAGEPGLALELVEVVGEAEEGGGSLEVLQLRIGVLEALGRRGEARRVEGVLLEEHSGSTAAMEILFEDAETRQRQGDGEGAIRAFQEVVAMAPSHNLAGEARMRVARIHLDRGRLEEALEVFQEYLADFPQGRRWDEVAFWAGHTLMELGREEEAGVVWGELRGRRALSFYTVLAGFLMEEDYDPPLSPAPDTLPFPPLLRGGLARLDRIRGAGLELGVDWEVGRLERVARAWEGDGGSGDALLRLAQELNHRGLTREGINLGWDVQREGRPLDRHLLEAIYPFPYRDLLMAEAEERGADPYLLAGLIRQESAFWHRALSRADARGLMQVLPATGRELARRLGPRGFDAEEHLYRPEINIHLGTAFFTDMRRRFGEDLSIILSAYNAGPTRARRWREYPEAGDLPRFVERIPFTETRGYVKNVLLNREIYAWLYGESLP